MVHPRFAARKSWKRPPQLRMASLMDILVVLLLFLIKSVVVEGQVVNPLPGVDLPESSSLERPEESVVVAILQDVILLGDQLVIDVEDVVADPDLLIDELEVLLDEVSRHSDELARLRGDEPSARKATIQGDRGIEFRVLQRVMYTLNKSGYEEVSLAVIRAA